MVRRCASERDRARRCCEKPCCQELLQAALGGLYGQDQCLEGMLDHLERAS